MRAEMTAAIKQTARRHLAEQGAPNLSLRAVARDLGVVSSALYRYFPSRDDLLTALIIDAYNSLGESVEQAEAAVDRSDLVARHYAACHAVRDWALAHPHEFALTYGSPVPGYVAPPDTVGPATRTTDVLISVLADGVAAGIVRPRPGEWLEREVQAEMVRLVAASGSDLPPAVMARGVMSWTHLFGAVSFEVFGRLTNMIDDRRAWFDHQVRAMAVLVGLRP
ncbi:MAG TPA: TetR/AcrR family transcriptional regulator [Micromonosporaceae bacterium]